MTSQDYELVQVCQADGDVSISHYVNKVTGLNIYHGFVESPIVTGDFVFATEAFDDDGLPHTLEHLVFMGSEGYPYKGVLDRLANKCLADGTNACTEVDHTNYTLRTAGIEGFLNLLPIYLDHLLFPTLTESAYNTEVHHINSDGEDAGVVYCEMQARENTGEERAYMEMLRSLYPGKCGYKSNTGGLLENLRTSTNNNKCREYHRQFYHTKNLALIIVGPLEPKEIFAAIKPIEDKVFKKQSIVEFQRPWQTPVPLLDQSLSRKIQYSSDTDDDGLVRIGFRGPEIATNYKEFVGISILLDYLNTTAISPIQREFVESSEPLCSSVDHSLVENSTSYIYLEFDGVGKEYMNRVCDKLQEILSNIVRGLEPIDMDRMKVVISRRIVRILSMAETSPHDVVISAAIGDFLYGDGDLNQRCQEISISKEFAKLESQFWIDLMDKYMVGKDARYVCIVAEPSPEMMQYQANQEKTRLEKQKQDLKDKLSEMAENLKESIEANEVPAPANMFSSIAVPSPENIKFHSIERKVLDKTQTPFRFQYDSIKTNFVSIHLLMNTSSGLSRNDRLYLPLMTEILIECPIEREGKLIPYEQVVAELYSDTISHGASIGLSGGSFNSVGLISMLFGIAMQVEISKYEKAVNWFRELLYRTVFTPERIKTIATRLVSDISRCKRSGSKVASAAINAMAFPTNSNQWAAGFMRQQKFLKTLLKDLQGAQQELTRIRDTMTRPNNILVHVSLNKDKIDAAKVHEPWLNLIPEEVIRASPSRIHINFDDITPCHSLVEPAEKPKAAVVGVGSVESNYMHQFVKSINSVKHPDLPATYVLLQYLTQLEGPLWRQLRGLGLSYSYSIDISPSEGLMKFLLYRSSHVLAAYNKSVEIVESHLSGEDEYEDDLFEAAKSSTMFELIKREKSAAGKSMQSLIAHIRDLDIDFNRNLVRQVAKVTKDDLRRVGQLYLKPLFKDEERRAVICCHPTKMDSLIEGFELVGCKLDRIKLNDEPMLNSID